MFCAGALIHSMAFLAAAQASLRCFRFGISMASSSATWRDAKSQSGCLSCGSLLANQRHQSATRYSQVGRPSCGGLLNIPACHQPSCLASEFCKVHGKSSVLVERGLSFGSRESKALIARLRSRGRIAVNNIHRHATAQGAVMQSSNILLGFEACVFSTPSPARRCLTGRSTRTPILARASIGALRASRYGAG